MTALLDFHSVAQFSSLRIVDSLVGGTIISGFAAALLRVARRCLRFFHAFLEALHCAAQIGADIAQFLRAEYQCHDQQNNQPVPNTQRTHDYSP